MSPLTRRGVLRGLSLTSLALATAPVLTACGGGTDAGGTDAGGTPGLELVSSDVRREVAPAAAVPGAVAQVHTLGAGLLSSLAAGTPGNLALSPFSVAATIGLTANGAVGVTRTEVLGVLGAADVESLDEGLGALTAYVGSLAGTVTGADGEPAELVLDSANALFGQRGVTWQAPFLDALARHYGAGMLTVDWKGATEAARDAVNAWAAKQTRDRITEILPGGSVGPDTRLVLVDALYLKAPWQQPFEEADTTTVAFHLPDGTTDPVPTMTQTVLTPYAAGEGYVAVQLPYAGGRVAMSLLLPDEGGLAALEQRIGAGGLPAVLEALAADDATQQVDLSLPRWTHRSQVSLSAPLAALGMATAFGEAADFSAMTTDEPLVISDVLHQVYVAVDESGTEAAAVTAVEMRATSMPASGVPVAFDRPFVYVVHDVEHGTPLFVGRVADPR